MIRTPPKSPLFPYPPLSRSPLRAAGRPPPAHRLRGEEHPAVAARPARGRRGRRAPRRVELRGSAAPGAAVRVGDGRDRKSTRLNSSHANISYAVFCLKKKKL